jgi:hypothetical protein
MKTIVPAVMELLASVEALKYISPDWGQMDYYDERPPVRFPCALIDIQSATFDHTADRIQQGEATIVVRLFDRINQKASANAPQTMRDNYNDTWQLMEDVNKALHGEALNDHVGAPMRSGLNNVKRQDGLRQIELSYTVQFTDTSCYKPPTRSPATVKIAPGFIKR